MSPDLALSVDGVAKRFRTFGSSLDKMLEYLSFGLVRRHRTFHALNGVSFEVRRGECVGILGTNGSGKSTILQIVAGTMRPTAGTVSVRGRVAALLELGAGFSPDFTGRENALLNARLLGCDEEEAQRALSRIEAFADIGDHIMQPVRTYSSGMYVRLAFAVAAAVEPDVFIVDEALAVGDHAFQAKCFARLRELRDRGTTILFVSHDLQSVCDFCDRAVWMDRGAVRAEGDTKQVVDAYLTSLRARNSRSAGPVPCAPPPLLTRDQRSADLRGVGPRSGNGRLKIVGVEVRGSDPDPLSPPVDAKRPFDLVFTVEAGGAVARPNVWFRIAHLRGTTFMTAGSVANGFDPGPLETGDRITVGFRMTLPIHHGIYAVGAYATDAAAERADDVLDGMETAFFLDVARHAGAPASHLLDLPAPATGSVQRGRSQQPSPSVLGAVA